MIGVARQRALMIVGRTMPKIVIATNTTARIGSGIGTAEPSATRGVVAPDHRSHSREKVDDHKKRAGDSRDKKDGQDPREKRRDFSPHPARDRSGNCECTHVDDDYTNVCAFLDATSAANRQTIDCYLLQSLTLRVTLAYLAYMSMSCLIQECGRRTISMKRRRCGFGRWALSTRSVKGRPSNFVYLVGGPILVFDLIIYNNLLTGDESISITANEIPSTYACCWCTNRLG